MDSTPGWLTDLFSFWLSGTLALNPERRVPESQKRKWSVSKPGIESLSLSPLWNVGQNGLIHARSSDCVRVWIAGPCYTEAWKGENGGRNGMYGAETIAFASTICILVSLTAGCLLGFVVATYRRSAVRDLASRAQTRRGQCHWTSAEKEGAEVVSNGAASVPLARLYAVFGSRQGTVTSRTSVGSGSTAAAATLHKACQTADAGSSKSTPTRRPTSVCRRVNLSCPPHSDVFVSNYARRPSAM